MFMSRILALALVVLIWGAPAQAEELYIRMLITDTDPKGTNVRESPGGQIIKVVPFGGKTDEEIEMRAVSVLGGENDWFEVQLNDGSRGWMHRSVLGACASATEDGPPQISANPDDFSPSVEIADSTPLQLEYGPVRSANTVWAKMSYTNSSGRKATGWMSREVMVANPHSPCLKGR